MEYVFCLYSEYFHMWERHIDSIEPASKWEGVGRGRRGSNDSQIVTAMIDVAPRRVEASVTAATGMPLLWSSVWNNNEQSMRQLIDYFSHSLSLSCIHRPSYLYLCLCLYKYIAVVARDEELSFSLSFRMEISDIILWLRHIWLLIDIYVVMVLTFNGSMRLIFFYFYWVTDKVWLIFIEISKFIYQPLYILNLKTFQPISINYKYF